MLSPLEMYELFKKLNFKHLVWPVEDLINPAVTIGPINYNPDFQRNYVWDDNKASFYCETIFLGSEIPPLLLFKYKNVCNVIDGRQRYETLLRYYNNEFYLRPKGLLTLKKFSGKYYKDLPEDIQKLFKESTLRTITISPQENSGMDDERIESLMRAIFRRYNMGISSLKEVELEKAKYLKNDIIQYFKEKLRKNPRIFEIIINLFLPKYINKDLNNPEILEKTIKKIRFILTLHKFKINYLAKCNNRLIVSDNFFAAMNLNSEEISCLYKNFEDKIELLNNIKINLETNNIQFNLYVFECIFWAITVLEQENIYIKNSDCSTFIKDIVKFIKNNSEEYFKTPAHYKANILDRFNTTAKFFEKYFCVNLQDYFIETEDYKLEIKKLFLNDPKQILHNHLQEYMLNKTRAEDFALSSIQKMLQSKKILLHPPYQRTECMNTLKASRLIESLLLDFKIPPIFLYTRKDGVQEVIDGQQRLLAFLGFLGEHYLDENGNEKFSNKNKFRLRNMEILKELEGKTFEKLDEKYKQKIREASIPIVEIREVIHKNFDPVDLFIRLNSKPYPIKMHSFEMWNTMLCQKFANIIKARPKNIVTGFIIVHNKAIQECLMKNYIQLFSF